MTRQLVVGLDDRGSFRCVKAIVGGHGRRMKGTPEFPEFRENWVFEPDVRILVRKRFVQTDAHRLDD